MSTRDRIGIAIPLIVLGLVIVLNVAVQRPRWRAMISLTGDIARAEIALSEILNTELDLDEAHIYLPEKLGGDMSADQHFLASVSAEMARLGLLLIQLEPKSDRLAVGDYRERSYLVEFGGNYEAIAQFLEYLEGVPEIVTMTSLDVRSNRVIAAGKGHRTLLNFTVTGY
jgi:Tfp pilus assembly protein PilO